MSKSVYSKAYRVLLSKLRRARKDARMTQVQTARLLRKPQSFVSKVESGERRLDVVELGKFARIYKKGLDFFVKRAR